MGASTARRQGEIWHHCRQDWLRRCLEEGLEQACHFLQLLTQLGDLFRETVHLRDGDRHSRGGLEK